LLQKTEAKVWTTETVIRSCAQECSDVGTHLVRTGYEWPTTVASFGYCCNDRDLCNMAAKQQQTVSVLALSICLTLLMNYMQ